MRQVSFNNMGGAGRGYDSESPCDPSDIQYYYSSLRNLIEACSKYGKDWRNALDRGQLKTLSTPDQQHLLQTEKKSRDTVTSCYKCFYDACFVVSTRPVQPSDESKLINSLVLVDDRRRYYLCLINKLESRYFCQNQPMPIYSAYDLEEHYQRYLKRRRTLSTPDTPSE